MRNATVRLSGVSIKNFKNVKKGELNFDNPRKSYRASVLGLYGQNGSGKTALIDVLQILKYILCGKAIDANTAYYINIDAPFADLEYVFDIVTSFGKYRVYYECKIRKEECMDEQNLDETDSLREKSSKAMVFDEILSYSFDGSGTKIRKSRLIDTNTNMVFVPVKKYDSLMGKDDNVKMNLLVAKKLAEQTSRSFIFSRELLNAARKHGMNNRQEEYDRHMQLIESLVFYGHYELFVINSFNAAMISMDLLPLAYKFENAGKRAAGMTLIPLGKPTVIQKDIVGLVEKVLLDMNIVLEQMVPGLSITLMDLGDQAMEHGQIGTRIQLMSLKNGKEIPLKYESEGIKKIVMILQLLIAVYNQTSITVAIDELDSGIFEYLLGEITRIVSEKGKGQLIFTSHNLRPLETIDRGFVAFTTTNPSNRYVRMMNVKDNNNLRDFYYREILLGVNDQSEELYEPTHNAEIAFAFREAGEIYGSQKD